MQSDEKKEERLAMVPMHQFFIDRLDRSMESKEWFEAAWIECSCLENRYFRTLNKYKRLCKYSKGKCRKSTNQLAISTKIKCVKRLYDAGVPCVHDAFSEDLLNRTSAWVKERNVLMHRLVSMEVYEEGLDEQLKRLATEGQTLVHDTYDACTTFRNLFYAEGYEFKFPESCMEACPCKPRPQEK